MAYKDNSGSRETESTLLSNESLELDVAVAPKILWGCITRNDVVLAEVINDALATACEQTAVQQTGKELLDRKRTAGFEYRLGELHSENPRLLKGIKFHVYEHIRDMAKTDVVSRSSSMRSITWAFALVFDAHHTTREEAQLCIKSMVTTTKRFHRSELSWHSTSDEMLGEIETIKLSLTRAVRQHMQDMSSQDNETKLQLEEELKKKTSPMKKLVGIFRRKKSNTWLLAGFNKLKERPPP